METRANFVLIGAFTLAAVLGAFVFVMWVAGSNLTGTHRHYQIVFNGSVSGLSNGALVLFNGLKVGEVTNLSFVEGNPSQVVADIEVTNPSAPINADTKAQLETQGLTGSATVALIGGVKGKGVLPGNPPVIPSLPTATLADLQTKAGYVLDLANKLLVDNALSIHQTIENVQTFSMALANNSGGVDAALKGVADLGKTVQPLAERVQTLSDDADRLVKAIDADKVRAIVDNVQGLSTKANSILDRADTLLADNSGAVHSTLTNLDAFSQALGDNASNVDAALKSLADLSKSIQPVAARIQTLSEDADRLVKTIDADKVRAIVDNVQGLSTTANSVLGRADRLLADNSDTFHSTLANLDAFSKALGDNASNVDAALKSLADLGKTIQPVAARIQTLSENADRLVQSVDPGQIRDVVGNARVFSQSLAESSDNFKSSDARQRLARHPAQRHLEAAGRRADRHRRAAQSGRTRRRSPASSIR